MIRMKKILGVSISKFYVIAVALISLIVIGSYYSYAMFTVREEKANAISIVTGNLMYTLTVDGEETNELVVPANSSKTFTVILSNPNNRVARFNFYYEYQGDISGEGVVLGYTSTTPNIPPVATGKNLEISGSVGSSETYEIYVDNEAAVERTITLGVSVGLDYNDLTLPSNGHLFEAAPPSVVEILLADNPVLEDVSGMFKYTNEGRQTTDGEVDSTYVTNGLYMMKDKDGESYYFRGNVDNLVQFGTYENDYYVYRYNNSEFQTLEACQASNSNCSEFNNRVLKYFAGTPMYWRIVRVNGDGTLRLLYSGTSKDATESNLMIGESKYNMSGNDAKYMGYTYDKGTDSLAKKEVDAWYINALSNSSYDKYIATGRFCSDSSGFDGEYFANYDRIIAGKPTLKCPITTETFGGSYNLKAGLMTVDEMVLGGNFQLISANNYLSSGSAYYWTMSPGVFDSGFAYVWGQAMRLGISNSVTGTFANLYLRPVINVSIDDLEIKGSGTVDDYYVLSAK